MNSRRFFQNLHVIAALSFQNPAAISHTLAKCGREGNIYLGSSLHAYLIKHPQFFDLKNKQLDNNNSNDSRNALLVWNSLLSMYSKCGKLSDAVKVFDNFPVRKDTVSSNSIISGFLRNGDIDTGFGYFKLMLNSGNNQFDQPVGPGSGLDLSLDQVCDGPAHCRFDQTSLTTILSAFEGFDFLVISKMVHGLVVLSGYEMEITVGNALIMAYFRCGCLDSGRQVFYEMVQRNVISWTAVISGLAHSQFYKDSLNLFREMYSGPVVPNNLTYLGALLACSGLQALKEGRQIHGTVCKLGINSDICVESSLMDMYCKCGCLNDAWQVFETAEVIDEVSMTVILSGFAQNGCEEDAIDIFVKMVKTGVEIDPNMVSAVLGVFGMDTSLGLGNQVHSLVIKKGFVSNPFINNGLINMYSKCGNLEDSVKVFNRTPQRNAISWNSIIAAFARHGDSSRALQLYDEMRADGMEPTDVTFLSLLHACSHEGLVDKGMQFLQSMEKDYGFKPRMEHYACIVDMLGRARLLKEAKIFIQKLPVKPEVLVWQALLGACGIHGDTEMGQYAADQLLLAAPNSPVAYVTMANIYSNRGRWKERARTIKRMKEVGAIKETGISWIEIEKKIHSFVVADQMHPHIDYIYVTLLKLFRHMRDLGYVPDKRFILFYMDQDKNECPVDDVQVICNSYVECMT